MQVRTWNMVQTHTQIHCLSFVFSLLHFVYISHLKSGPRQNWSLRPRQYLWDWSKMRQRQGQARKKSLSWYMPWNESAPQGVQQLHIQYPASNRFISRALTTGDPNTLHLNVCVSLQSARTRQKHNFYELHPQLYVCAMHCTLNLATETNGCRVIQHFLALMRGSRKYKWQQNNKTTINHMRNITWCMYRVWQ